VNAILDWNETYLQAVRLEGGAPGPIARAGAMLHIAMHDAIASIVRTHAPYLPGLTAVGTESPVAAAHRAAHLVLTALYPRQRELFDTALAELAVTPPAPSAARQADLAGQRIGAAAWDAKYAAGVDLWRPETAVQLAHLDGNGDTEADPLWTPLSTTYGGSRFSPPFPAYVSGHATFGAAHGRMMANHFGTDHKTFTLGTEEPFAPGVKRTYKSFSAAARENGISRVYLGVHYRWDAEMAYPAGVRLADHIAATLLTTV